MEFSISLLLKGIYLLIAATLIAKTLRFLANYIYKWYVYNNIPGLPITLPFIGNLHYLKPRKELFQVITGFSRSLKEHQIWTIWLGTKPIIIFHKAEALDILMSSSKNTAKSYEYKFLHPWLGEGLLTSYGEKWQFRRRLLTPAFHFQILDDFLHVMNEQAEILVEILANESKAGKKIDIFKRMILCTLDVICETAMGQNVNAQNDENSQYVRATSKISELVIHRMFRPYLWPDLIYSNTSYGRDHKKSLEVLHNFARNVIVQRDADFDESLIGSSTRRQAFLDILLKAKRDDPTITFDDIREEVDTFMFEGHDTTAAAASWACHLIGSHPDVQKKLHEEIDRVLGSTNRPLTKDDLNDLDYLDRVIKETLRLFPSVSFYGRTFSEDGQVGDCKVLEGDTAVILAYMVHRDEKYFPDPERFDPDRFLPENCKDRHPYAYIPFSAGKRNCIGQRFAQMEEKVLLANVLRRFEIKSLKTTEELNPVAELITRPFDGIPIELKLRI